MIHECYSYWRNQKICKVFKRIIKKVIKWAGEINTQFNESKDEFLRSGETQICEPRAHFAQANTHSLLKKAVGIYSKCTNTEQCFIRWARCKGWGLWVQAMLLPHEDLSIKRQKNCIDTLSKSNQTSYWLLLSFLDPTNKIMNNNWKRLKEN